jgi:hypothetical protein
LGLLVLVRRRLLESFGSFHESAWLEAFAEDVRGAQRVRIASGFMDQRGARDLMQRLDDGTHVEVLLGLQGCSGPEVIDELQKRPDVIARGSRVVDFHWKVACIESEAGRVIFLGSANFTRKGLSGRGEIMLRLAGSALESGCWDAIQADFDDYFSEYKTWPASDMKELLGRVEALGDKARDAQADFQVALEKAIAEMNAGTLPPDERVWLVIWNCDFTPRQAALANRAMGPIPSEAAWTRGEVSGVNERMKLGNIMLGYSRDATWFVLGRVAKLCKVDTGGPNGFLVADLEHRSRRVTRVQLSGDTESTENPAVYEGIRAAIRGQEDGTLMSLDVSSKVLAVLRGSGLLTS